MPTPPRPKGRQPIFDVADILDRYAAGQTGAQIARALGLSRDRVYRLLHGAGVAMRPSGHRPIAIDMAQAAQLYTQGLTMTQIAGRCGCSRPSIAKLLTAAGVDLSAAAQAARRSARAAERKAAADRTLPPVLRVERLDDGRYALVRTSAEGLLVAAPRQADVIAWARDFRDRSCPGARIVVLRASRPRTSAKGVRRPFLQP